jgi:hypothetical protein
MKDIKDYLHLYLGCECQAMGQLDENDKPRISKLTGISYDDTQCEWWAYFENEESGYAVVSDVFPILRPLNNMTAEELDVFTDLNMKSDYQTIFEKQAEITRWLLSKHFDLFQLIEAGLAIDKTKLNHETTNI